jgi:hypothetical protein
VSQGVGGALFAAAYEHERGNGNAYREFELALPVELSDVERGRLVREFVAEQIGERHAYGIGSRGAMLAATRLHHHFLQWRRDFLRRGLDLPESA